MSARRKRTRHIPIVFLTALFRDDTHLLQAYSAGAVDMVFKPVDPFILRSKVQVFVDLYLKQAEISREAELRHRLQEENFRVRAEKLSTEQALRRSQEHQEAMAKAEAHQRTLIEELNHRVKNMLTVVNAMARQTLASKPVARRSSPRSSSAASMRSGGRTRFCRASNGPRSSWPTSPAKASSTTWSEDKKRVVLEGPAVRARSEDGGGARHRVPRAGDQCGQARRAVQRHRNRKRELDVFEREASSRCNGRRTGARRFLRRHAPDSAAA